MEAVAHPRPRPVRQRHARASVAGLRWRLIRDEPQDGARNMALDHALAESLEEGEGVVRLYGWKRPTVSFGRNEPARERYRTGSEAGVQDFVRRPTGGRAVLHDHELTYCVVAPLGALGRLRDAYVRINEALVVALAELGVPAEVAGSGRVLDPSAGPCFGVPVAGEIVVDGRKLVGSAQARVGGALLQHGSILLDGDQAVLEAMAGAALPESPMTLRNAIGDVSIDKVAGAVAAGLRRSLRGDWSEGGYRPAELEHADRLERSRYALDSWTWRR